MVIFTIRSGLMEVFIAGCSPKRSLTNSYPIGTFTPVFFANAVASG